MIAEEPPGRIIDRRNRAALFRARTRSRADPEGQPALCTIGPVLDPAEAENDAIERRQLQHMSA